MPLEPGDYPKLDDSELLDGTVCLTVNSVTDTFNIRRFVSYRSENDTNHGGEFNMRISKKRRKTNKKWFFTHDSKL